MATDLSREAAARQHHLAGWWVVRHGPLDRAARRNGSAGSRAVVRALASGPDGPCLGLLASSEEALPPRAADGAAVVVFDGVLFNRAELQRQMPRPTAASGDAQLVLHAYRRWGEAALPKLRGMFALALWDERRRMLLVARDPLGTYPLFYAWAGPELLLSTSIEALLRHSGVSRAVSRVMLACYLWHRWLDVEETFFAAVRRLPPGHAMRVGDDGCRVFRYWDPAPPDRPFDWIPAEEVEGRFERTMDQVIAAYLELGPAGIFLSGGLDSVSVAAAALEVSRAKGLPPPWALSLVFPDPSCNEETVQRGVARALGLPQVLLPLADAVGPAGLLQATLEACRDWPVPLLNTWWPAYERLAQEGKRHGCAVILTGSGGDEWLGVNPVLAADLMRALDLAGLVQFWRMLQRSYGGPPLAILRAVLWTYGLRLLLPPALHRGLGRVGSLLPHALRGRSASPAGRAWVAPDPEIRQEIQRRVERAAARSDGQAVGGGLYVRDMRRALDHPVIAMEKEEVFESGRRLQMPMLRPYWEADLVELLLRTPPHVLNKGGRSKGLVRSSLARRFPHLGFERQKKVWATNFFRTTMAREGARVWEAMGGARALADLGVVDLNLLTPIVDEAFEEGRGRHASLLWEVLSLEAWLRPRV